MLTLVTLGGLTLHGAGAPPEPARIRKPLVLLALVALGGNGRGSAGVSRDRLQSLLWPESDGERARGALKQAQYLLRQALGVDPFVARGAGLAVDPAVLDVDAARFDDAVREGRLEDAVALYGGPFLEGVYLRDAPEFERWADAERARLAAAYGRGLEGLATTAATRNDPDAAVHWWCRRAALDPLDGRIARSCAEALVASGAHEAALRHVRVHVELVRAELGATPDAALLALAERLRTPASAPPIAAPRGRESLADASATDAPVPAPERPAEPPARRPRRWWREAALVVGTLGVAASALITARGHTAGDRPAALDSSDAIAPASARSASAPGTIAEVVRSSVAADRSDPPARRDIGRVLVTPLDDESGDSVYAAFGRLAADWMATGLAQTGLVDVVDAQTTAALLGVAGHDLGRDGRALRELAGEAHARTVVVGRYLVVQDSLVAQVMIESADDGRLLRTLPRTAVRRRDLGDALALLRDRVAGAFATLVDPRVESLVDRSVPAPSLDAYRAYAEGLDCYVRAQGGGDPDGCNAARSLEAAIAADSSWTLPYVWLMNVRLGDGSPARVVDTLLAVLERRRQPLSELDRHAIEFFRRSRLDDLEGALAAARRAVALAPRSNWTYLAASTAGKLGRYRESLALLRGHDPQHAWVRGWLPYVVLLRNDEHLLGDHRAELRDMQQAERTDPQSVLLVGYRLGAMVALGDSVAILHTVDSLLQIRPDLQRGGGVPLGSVLVTVARDAAAHGRVALSRAIAERSLAAFDPVSVGTRDERDALLARVGFLHQLERWTEAKAALERIVAEPSAAPFQVAVALRQRADVDAHLGDTVSAARSIQNALTRSFPSARSGDSLMLTAQLLAIRGEKARVVELLRQVSAGRAGVEMRVHQDPDFRPLVNYPPLRALLAPRG